MPQSRYRYRDHLLEDAYYWRSILSSGEQPRRASRSELKRRDRTDRCNWKHGLLVVPFSRERVERGVCTNHRFLGCERYRGCVSFSAPTVPGGLDPRRAVPSAREPRPTPWRALAYWPVDPAVVAQQFLERLPCVALESAGIPNFGVDQLAAACRGLFFWLLASHRQTTLQCYHFTP